MIHAVINAYKKETNMIVGIKFNDESVQTALGYGGKRESLHLYGDKLTTLSSPTFTLGVAM